eukprot:TRINITY_DN991_c10_g1_i1.p1 TRINITY_DN991_c10_g1~~TRINITY_DN991_c10_g1_i1.p1  ORF type:complete len:3005 (+),score=720.90 TRINITY_DN991_c10_g1_i1:66-9017(+)
MSASRLEIGKPGACTNGCRGKSFSAIARNLISPMARILHTGADNPMSNPKSLYDIQTVLTPIKEIFKKFVNDEDSPILFAGTAKNLYMIIHCNDPTMFGLSKYCSDTTDYVAVVYSEILYSSEPLYSVYPIVDGLVQFGLSSAKVAFKKVTDTTFWEVGKKGGGWAKEVIFGIDIPVQVQTIPLRDNHGIFTGVVGAASFGHKCISYCDKNTFAHRVSINASEQLRSYLGDSISNPQSFHDLDDWARVVIKTYRTYEDIDDSPSLIVSNLKGDIMVLLNCFFAHQGDKDVWPCKYVGPSNPYLLYVVNKTIFGDLYRRVYNLDAGTWVHSTWDSPLTIGKDDYVASEKHFWSGISGPKWINLAPSVSHLDGLKMFTFPIYDQQKGDPVGVAASTTFGKTCKNRCQTDTFAYRSTFLLAGIAHDLDSVFVSPRSKDDLQACIEDMMITMKHLKDDIDSPKLFMGNQNGDFWEIANCHHPDNMDGSAPCRFANPRTKYVAVMQSDGIISTGSRRKAFEIDESGTVNFDKVLFEEDRPYVLKERPFWKSGSKGASWIEQISFATKKTNMVFTIPIRDSNGGVVLGVAAAVKTRLDMFRGCMNACKRDSAVRRVAVSTAGLLYNEFDYYYPSVKVTGIIHKLWENLVYRDETAIRFIEVINDKGDHIEVIDCHHPSSVNTNPCNEASAITRYIAGVRLANDVTYNLKYRRISENGEYDPNGDVLASRAAIDPLKLNWYYSAWQNGGAYLTDGLQKQFAYPIWNPTVGSGDLGKVVGAVLASSDDVCKRQELIHETDLCSKGSLIHISCGNVCNDNSFAKRIAIGNAAAITSVFDDFKTKYMNEKNIEAIMRQLALEFMTQIDKSAPFAWIAKKEHFFGIYNCWSRRMRFGVPCLGISPSQRLIAGIRAPTFFRESWNKRHFFPISESGMIDLSKDPVYIDKSDYFPFMRDYWGVGMEGGGWMDMEWFSDPSVIERVFVVPILDEVRTDVTKQSTSQVEIIGVAGGAKVNGDFFCGNSCLDNSFARRAAVGVWSIAQSMNDRFTSPTCQDDLNVGFKGLHRVFESYGDSIDSPMIFMANAQGNFMMLTNCHHPFLMEGTFPCQYIDSARTKYVAMVLADNIKFDHTDEYITTAKHRKVFPLSNEGIVLWDQLLTIDMEQYTVTSRDYWRGGSIQAGWIKSRNLVGKYLEQVFSFPVFNSDTIPEELLGVVGGVKLLSHVRGECGLGCGRNIELYRVALAGSEIARGDLQCDFTSSDELDSAQRLFRGMFQMYSRVQGGHSDGIILANLRGDYFSLINCDLPWNRILICNMAPSHVHYLAVYYSITFHKDHLPRFYEMDDIGTVNFDREISKFTLPTNVQNERWFNASSGGGFTEKIDMDFGSGRLDLTELYGYPVYNNDGKVLGVSAGVRRYYVDVPNTYEDTCLTNSAFLQPAAGDLADRLKNVMSFEHYKTRFNNPKTPAEQAELFPFINEEFLKHEDMDSAYIILLNNAGDYWMQYNCWHQFTASSWECIHAPRWMQFVAIMLDKTNKHRCVYGMERSGKVDTSKPIFCKTDEIYDLESTQFYQAANSGGGWLRAQSFTDKHDEMLWVYPLISKGLSIGSITTVRLDNQCRNSCRVDGFAVTVTRQVVKTSLLRQLDYLKCVDDVKNALRGLLDIFQQVDNGIDSREILISTKTHIIRLVNCHVSNPERHCSMAPDGQHIIVFIGVGNFMDEGKVYFAPLMDDGTLAWSVRTLVESHYIPNDHDYFSGLKTGGGWLPNSDEHTSTYCMPVHSENDMWYGVACAVQSNTDYPMAGSCVNSLQRNGFAHRGTIAASQIVFTNAEALTLSITEGQVRGIALEFATEFLRIRDSKNTSKMGFASAKANLWFYAVDCSNPVQSLEWYCNASDIAPNTIIVIAHVANLFGNSRGRVYSYNKISKDISQKPFIGGDIIYMENLKWYKEAAKTGHAQWFDDIARDIVDETYVRPVYDEKNSLLGVAMAETAYVTPNGARTDQCKQESFAADMAFPLATTMADAVRSYSRIGRDFTKAEIMKIVGYVVRDISLKLRNWETDILAGFESPHVSIFIQSCANPEYTTVICKKLRVEENYIIFINAPVFGTTYHAFHYNNDSVRQLVDIGSCDDETVSVDCFTLGLTPFDMKHSYKWLSFGSGKNELMELVMPVSDSNGNGIVITASTKNGNCYNELVEQSTAFIIMNKVLLALSQEATGTAPMLRYLKAFVESMFKAFWEINRFQYAAEMTIIGPGEQYMEFKFCSVMAGECKAIGDIMLILVNSYVFPSLKGELSRRVAFKLGRADGSDIDISAIDYDSPFEMGCGSPCYRPKDMPLFTKMKEVSGPNWVYDGTTISLYKYIDRNRSGIVITQVNGTRNPVRGAVVGTSGSSYTVLRHRIDLPFINSDLIKTNSGSFRKCIASYVNVPVEFVYIIGYDDYCPIEKDGIMHLRGLMNASVTCASTDMSKTAKHSAIISFQVMIHTDATLAVKSLKDHIESNLSDDFKKLTGQTLPNILQGVNMRILPASGVGIDVVNVGIMNKSGKSQVHIGYGDTMEINCSTHGLNDYEFINLQLVFIDLQSKEKRIQKDFGSVAVGSHVHWLVDNSTMEGSYIIKAAVTTQPTVTQQSDIFTISKLAHHSSSSGSLSSSSSSSASTSSSTSSSYSSSSSHEPSHNKAKKTYELVVYSVGGILMLCIIILSMLLARKNNRLEKAKKYKEDQLLGGGGSSLHTTNEAVYQRLYEDNHGHMDNIDDLPSNHNSTSTLTAVKNYFNMGDNNNNNNNGNVQMDDHYEEYNPQRYNPTYSDNINHNYSYGNEPYHYSGSDHQQASSLPPPPKHHNNPRRHNTVEQPRHQQQAHSYAHSQSVSSRYTQSQYRPPPIITNGISPPLIAPNVALLTSISSHPSPYFNGRIPAPVHATTDYDYNQRQEVLQQLQQHRQQQEQERKNNAEFEARASEGMMNTQVEEEEQWEKYRDYYHQQQLEYEQQQQQQEEED